MGVLIGILFWAIPLGLFVIGLLTLGRLSYRQGVQEMRDGDGFRRRATGLAVAVLVGAGLTAGLAATRYDDGRGRPTRWSGLGGEGQAIYAAGFALAALVVAGLVWSYWLRRRAGVAGVVSVAGAALASLWLSVAVVVIAWVGIGR